MNIKNRTKIKATYGIAPQKIDNVLKVWKILPDLCLFLIFVLYIAMTLVFVTNYNYYKVRQTSMRPLLNNYDNPDINDGVYVNLRAIPEVGDVIIVNYYINEETSLIKRLIGDGGDKIAITETTLSDGITKKYEVLRIPKGNSTPYALVENYVSPENRVFGMKKVYDNFTLLLNAANKETINGIDFLVIADDEIFYMGDNRGNSDDGSKYGAVKRRHLVGRVDIIVHREQNSLFHIFEYMLGFRTV